MFTVQQRDALRERVLRLAQADARVVAGAAVGSLALGGGGRFSDLDLTFAIADHVPLTDWTRTLRDERAAVPLADLVRGPTTYRVYLLPAALQCDLSLTPAALLSPRRTALPAALRPDRGGRGCGSDASGGGDARLAHAGGRGGPLGWGVIYALHARACIERGRVWQAEHYVGAVRDHALALACLREGAPGGAGARLRRPVRGDAGALRGDPRWSGGAGGATCRTRRSGARAAGRGRGGGSGARGERRAAPRGPALTRRCHALSSPYTCPPLDLDECKARRPANRACAQSCCTGCCGCRQARRDTHKMTPRPCMKIPADWMRSTDAGERRCSLAHHAAHEGRRLHEWCLR